MNNCGHCGGDCSHCAGCGASLTLTLAELEFLKKLGEFAFLPVARMPEDETPVFLGDEEHSREEYSLILQCLEKKGLISLDYDKPLKAFDDSAYAAYPIRGSMALTQRGHTVLELLERQGITDE